ncbi:serine/threonine protein kinase [Thermophilibacter provencensis]|uniref:non-specific serine/threonine protein kinase n=1 Tax=Thermophilibacter provencensis TaxID=1852386 RepID=A0ABT7V5F3_9ACTN|nr:serine/threonine-protein kinase [Thermophilibacter provencensis]MDM8271837.1 serine/threonine-protein kinase [Thermophilibacter provencensis]
METDELATYLASLERDSCYRVDVVYKESRLETTQRVFFVGENGAELGPFVRKYLAPGLGGAYERIYAAQRDGVRLPHLPRIVECHRQDERLVVVMEHVAGKTLADVTAAATDHLGLVRQVFPDLCDAVSELHELLDPPVIHRDLKPSNVMVSAGGITLIDLGIARVWKEGAEQDTTHFGTRVYAPPEQFGFGQTGVASDVYALGMLLFFCLTGREPTAADREGGFVGAGVSEALREVVVRATQLDPAARFSSVRELRDALLAALDKAGEKSVCPQEPPTFERRAPRPGTLLSRVPRWAGAIWNLVVVGLTFVLVVGCVMAVVDPTPENAAQPLWYLVVSYFVFLVPCFLIGCYLLLDRRWLRREIPALTRFTVRQETRAGLLVMLALFVVWIVAAFIAGA